LVERVEDVGQQTTRHIALWHAWRDAQLYLSDETGKKTFHE